MSTPPADRGVPDVGALRRRVLLAAVLTLSLFVAASYVVSTLGVGQGWLLVVMVLIYLGVTRPLMAPVRELTRLRRRLAFQAFLEQREAERSPQEEDPR